MDEADWAISEFGPALLGDNRRTARLIALATVLAQRPEVSLPVACDDPAMRKGAYPFFENKAIEPAEILASHGEACAGWFPHPRSLAVERAWDKPLDTGSLRAMITLPLGGGRRACEPADELPSQHRQRDHE